MTSLQDILPGLKQSLRYIHEDCGLTHIRGDKIPGVFVSC